MKSKIEIRVRTVQRHLVTEWEENCGSRVIGEFESSSLADEVAAALQAKTPGATVVDSRGAVTARAAFEYVIVAKNTFEVENLAYFADSAEGAEAMRQSAQSRHGMEFGIFLRQADLERGFIKSAKVHTAYPSRYAIGEKVLRKACDVRGDGGMLHPYAAEPAEIWAVHFYPGKVCYQVTYPSGRTMESVDSVELEDLS